MLTPPRGLVFNSVKRRRCRQKFRSTNDDLLRRAVDGMPLRFIGARGRCEVPIYDGALYQSDVRMIDEERIVLTANIRR